MGRARGLVAAVAVAPRRTDSAGSPRLRTFDLRRVCDEHDLEVSPALADSRFYHVTSRQALERIRTEGLQPNGVSGAMANFGEYHVEDDCIYLWPSVGNAQAYLYEHADRFADVDRVILEVDGLDLTNVCPDQEELARYWADADENYPFRALLVRAHEEAGGDFPAPGEELAYEDSAQLIREVSPHTRLALANLCAVHGDAVMIRESAAPETLAVAELNDYESLDERFSEEHPHLDPFVDGEHDEDIEMQREETYERWLETETDGGHIIFGDELREQLMDPSELIGNEHRRYFHVRPLAG